MSVETALAVAGGMKIYGQLEANKSESAAHTMNAAFLREQAKQAGRLNKLELSAFDIESRQFLGSQVNAFAKSGVSPSGSALLKMAASKAQISNEYRQIEETGRANMEAYLFKAKQSEDAARQLSNMSLLQTVATAVDTAASIASVKST